MFRLLVALVLTVALGVLSRLHPVGWSLYDKSLGDALYAVAAYLGVAAIFRRRSSLIVALLALGWCLAVECFKLTGVPAHYSHLAVVRWVLGTTFSWHNVVCYGVGVVGIVAVDVALLRPGPRAGARRSSRLNNAY